MGETLKMNKFFRCIKLTAFLLFLIILSPAPSGAAETAEKREFTPAIFSRESLETIDSNGHKVMRLDIGQTVTLAIANNPDIKIAKAKIEQAVSDYYKTKAGMNVKLSLTGSYARIDPVSTAKFQLDSSQPAKEIKLGDENNFSGKAVLEKVITTFGKLEYAIAASALQVSVMEGNHEVTRQEIIFQTKQGYFRALQARGLARIAREKLDIVRQQYKITRNLFDAGVVPRFEVLKAQLAVSKTRQAVISARKQAQLADSSLMNLIYLDQCTPIILEQANKLKLIAVEMKQAQIMAVEKRPEIKALLLSRKAVGYLLESARRGHNPVLLFSSSAENKTISGFNSNPNTFTQMLVLSIPLSDGGETAANIRKTTAELEELDQNIRKLYQNFQLQVKEAVLTIKEVEARLAASRQDVVTATEGYAIARTRYENGLSTSLELNDALQNLNEAKINLLVTENEYRIAVAKLERATATTWKEVTEK